MRKEEGYLIMDSVSEALEFMGSSDKDWRLCYEGDIPKESYDWVKREDYPNPDYVPGRKERYAYFSPNFSYQWGDDWGDTMDESSEPLTDPQNGIDNILVVPYAIPYEETIFNNCGSIEDPTFTYDSSRSHLCPMIVNRCEMPWITVMMYPSSSKYRHPYDLRLFPLKAGAYVTDMERWLGDIKTFIENNYIKK